MMRLAIAALVLGTLVSLPLRPLWLDEIYQLEGTWQQPFGQMIHSSMLAPGGMPAAYTAQKVWLDAVGFSAAKARVPAVIFGLGAAFVIFWTARLLGLNAPLALLLSLITPLLFRYSTEARPYSQGLFFSALSTALFLRWRDVPTAAGLGAYFLSCLAGIYSQPFSLFIPAAHAVYVFVADRRRLLPIFSVVVLTGLLYAPWVIASHRVFAGQIWPKGMSFGWSQISPLMMLREISGGGYVCSVTLLAFAIAGLRRKGLQPMVFCVGIPVVLAVAADVVFKYFFAIRQLIFVLPPLLLLATAGIEELWERRKTATAVLAGLFITGAVVKDIRWQMDHKEDWARAAATIGSRLDRTSGCVAFQPPQSALNYYFFEPSLRRRTCDPHGNQRPTLVATSPYAQANQRIVTSGVDNVGNTLISAPPQ